MTLKELLRLMFPPPIIGPDVYAAEKLEQLGGHLDYLNLKARVADELSRNFYGTFCGIEVTGIAPRFLAMLMYEYRQAGWVIEYSVFDYGSRRPEYLTFREAKSAQMAAQQEMMLR